MSSEGKNLLREMYSSYAASVGLDPDARYLHGTPLRPVVPLDHATGGLFVLGAYPSSRFAQIGSAANVPVADNMGPFESERWFDGARVRVQPSARELESYFLSPLGIERDTCWITDLVKVFLFKPGHARTYADLGAAVPQGYSRDRFSELGSRSLPWIERELAVAKPSLMITLGAEVAGVVRGVTGSAAQTRLLTPEVMELEVGAQRVKAVHCAHPGILMRFGDRNPWPQRHTDEFLPVLRAALASNSASL